ncbi:LysE family translocator [Raineyella fluvialis]|uniref:LysE family translocator n=1 Tax=Raineyella fluvialis TaxID=2662261 RepID=A0A5Q2FCP5_9ACTN|nr:LysE family translocator [Raineyella fluvialis]QGF24569.1 LysE family translocator [Raineyella fluvialis]
MAIGSLAAFWVVSFLLVLTPGADWAYAISAGLRHRSVIPAVGGLLSGYVMITLVVAAGVAALLARTPGALGVLTYAGAGYLAWLGLTTIRHPPTPQQAADAPDNSWMAQLCRGAAVSGLNPKALLLFLALLPQFTDPAGHWPVALQVAALGGLHIVSSGVVYLGVGSGSRAVLRTRPAAARAVGRFSGIAMTLIAIGLLVEQLTRL